MDWCCKDATARLVIDSRRRSAITAVSLLLALSFTVPGNLVLGRDGDVGDRPAHAWTRQFGTDGYEEATGVAVDPRSGSAWVVGTTSPTDSEATDGPDGTIRRIAANGETLWSRRFSYGYQNRPADVAVDRNRNAYVIGQTFTFDEPSGDRAFIRSYTEDGRLRWSRFLLPYSYGFSLAIASDGDIVVTGSIDDRPFLRKYSAAGALRWSRSAEAAGRWFAVTTDKDGGIWAVGSEDTDAGWRDFVRRFDSEGSERWAQFLPPLQRGIAVAVVRGGRSWVSGWIEPKVPGGEGYVLLRSFDSDGSPLEEIQFGYPGTGTEDGLGVAPAGDGGVWLTGRTRSPRASGGVISGADVAFLRRYSASGKLLWAREFGPPSTGAYAVSSDGRSSVWVAGTTGGTFPGQSNAGLSDGFVRRYGGRRQP